MSNIELKALECSCEKPILDVVFIHGLGGHAVETWTNSAKAFWPDWIAADFSDVAVWTLSYPAAMTTSVKAGGGMGVIQLGDAVAACLLAYELGQQRPIVFITHSLGGLVAKQVLRSCADSANVDKQTLLSKVVGAVFLGTPHMGSGLASMAKIYPLASKLIDDLQKSDDYLLNLNGWFQSYANDNDFFVLPCAETEKTSGFVVVDQVAANPQVVGADLVVCPGNHHDICKPADRTSLVYMVIWKALKKLSDRAAAETQEPEILEDYEYYTNRVSDDRLNLEQKLQLADRTDAIRSAARLKERFTKNLYKNALQPSAQRRYLQLLAETETRFQRHVVPQIEAGANRHDIDAALEVNLLSPLKEAFGNAKAFEPIALTLDGVLYFLTGNCHIKWHSEKDEEAES